MKGGGIFFILFSTSLCFWFQPGGSTVALFVLAATTAGAGIVPAHPDWRFMFFLLRGEHLHYLIGVPPGPDQFAHHPHRPVDMGKKVLVTFAEIVEARFTVRCQDKPVSGAFAVAGKENRALPAETGKGVPFVLPELSLFC